MFSVVMSCSVWWLWFLWFFVGVKGRCSLGFADQKIDLSNFSAPPTARWVVRDLDDPSSFSFDDRQNPVQWTVCQGSEQFKRCKFACQKKPKAELEPYQKKRPKGQRRRRGNPPDNEFVDLILGRLLTLESVQLNQEISMVVWDGDVIGCPQKSRTVSILLDCPDKENPPIPTSEPMIFEYRPCKYFLYYSSYSSCTSPIQFSKFTLTNPISTSNPPTSFVNAFKKFSLPFKPSTETTTSTTSLFASVPFFFSGEQLAPSPPTFIPPYHPYLFTSVGKCEVTTPSGEVSLSSGSLVEKGYNISWNFCGTLQNNESSCHESAVCQTDLRTGVQYSAGTVLSRKYWTQEKIELLYIMGSIGCDYSFRTTRFSLMCNREEEVSFRENEPCDFSVSLSGPTFCPFMNPHIPLLDSSCMVEIGSTKLPLTQFPKIMHHRGRDQEIWLSLCGDLEQIPGCEGSLICTSKPPSGPRVSIGTKRFLGAANEIPIFWATSFSFVDGDPCDLSHNWTTEVHLICDPERETLAVFLDDSILCTYTLFVITPLICPPQLKEKLIPEPCTDEKGRSLDEVYWPPYILIEALLADTRRKREVATELVGRCDIFPSLISPRLKVPVQIRGKTRKVPAYVVAHLEESSARDSRESKSLWYALFGVLGISVLLGCVMNLLLSAVGADDL